MQPTCGFIGRNCLTLGGMPSDFFMDEIRVYNRSLTAVSKFFVIVLMTYVLLSCCYGGTSNIRLTSDVIIFFSNQTEVVSDRIHTPLDGLVLWYDGTYEGDILIDMSTSGNNATLQVPASVVPDGELLSCKRTDSDTECGGNGACGNTFCECESDYTGVLGYFTPKNGLLF